ncbi:MAG: hypothetical protein WB565_09155 [Acidimicrobiales bacterium]
MTDSELKAALDELFDRQLLFHGYTPFMRDYDLVIYESVDPASGLSPRHRRFRFRFCTEATVRSRVRPDVWSRSLSDDLVQQEHVTMESTGYVWGVRGQELYPGATIVRESERARYWHEQVGVPFWEVQIEANAHEIRLVFSDLSVADIESGYAAFAVASDGVAERFAEGSKIPLSPPDE